MRTIHRTLAWLLALLVLVSLLCPAMAFATEDSDQDQIQKSSEEADNIKLSDVAAEDQKTGNGGGNETELSMDNTQVDASQVEQAGTSEKEKASSGDGQNNKTEPEKQENNAADGSDQNDEQKSQSGSLEKKSDDGTSAGSLSSADGNEKQSRRSSVMELFISENGSDETGNGTYEAPFATLNAALGFAGDSDVEIILSLMTDLCLSETVPIVGNVVTVTGDDGAKKITRAEDFNGHFDPEEEHSTALFEVGTTDPENNPGGSLLVEGIVIDEEFMQTDPVQDAMIEVYDRGKLILGDDVLLLNYGGKSAVHGWAGSEVVVSDGTWILDNTTVEENGTLAVQHDEGCTYSQGAASIVLSHGEEYDEVYGEKQEEETDESGKDTETGAVAGSSSNTNASGESAGNDSIGKTDSDNADSDSTDDVEEEDGNKKAGNEDVDNKDTGSRDVSKEVAGNSKNSGNKDADNAGNDSLDDVVANADDTALAAPKIQKQRQSAGGKLMLANDGTKAENVSSSVSYILSAPEGVSQKSTKKTINSYTVNGTVEGYLIPYTITLNLSDHLDAEGAVVAQTITTTDIELFLQLDKLLYPETTEVGQNTIQPVWEYTFLSASAVYDSSTSSVTISLKANEESLGEIEDLASVLSGPLSLTINTVVPSSMDYPQQAQVTGTLKQNILNLSTEKRNGSPDNNLEEKSAVTKLLDDNKAATLIYDPNGGTGGPGTQSLPAEINHQLEMENVPTHSDVNGTRVLFYGWTTEKDSKIYTNGETAPETIKTLTLEEGKEYNVYAVYSTDRNGDGKPDVDQLTLGFDGNAQNAIGVPGPIIQSAGDSGNSSFVIPEQEPTCKYYTFRGWSKDENATVPTYKYDGAGGTEKLITISEDTLLYAVWKANPVYTLYFDGNGGTNVPAAQSAPSDNGVANLTITKQIPARSGRTFVGWATQRYGTASFDPGEAVKLTGGDVTLYAVWERNSSWSSRAPKTGDESNVPLYVVLAVCSAGAAYAVYRVLKKRGGR